jgi:hypothetical protein
VQADSQAASQPKTKSQTRAKIGVLISITAECFFLPLKSNPLSPFAPRKDIHISSPSYNPPFRGAKGDNEMQSYGRLSLRERMFVSHCDDAM